MVCVVRNDLDESGGVVGDGVLADGNVVLDGDVAGGDVVNDDAVDGFIQIERNSLNALARPVDND